MAEGWLEIAELDRARQRQWERGEKHPGLAGAAPTGARAGKAHIRNHLRDRAGILREELI